jgi:hypothetical protein
MKINKFIQENLKVTYPAEEYSSLVNLMATSRLPRIVCNDGFSLSVQVGYSLYSKPKKVAKRYSEVEIGYPSEPESLIAEYAEDWEVQGLDDPRLCETVYGYVPVKIVDKVLKKHGGIDMTETMNRAEQNGLGEEIYE